MSKTGHRDAGGPPRPWSRMTSTGRRRPVGRGHRRGRWRPLEWSRSAAATGWPPPCARSGSSAPTSPRSSPWPTTAGPRDGSRDELGVLPPGDLRQALAALCRDDEWGRTWASVLQHRFASRRRAQRPRRREPADRRALGPARRACGGARLGGPAAGCPGSGAADGRRTARHRGDRPGGGPAAPGRAHDRAWAGPGGDDQGPRRVRRAGAAQPAGMSGGVGGHRGRGLGRSRPRIVVHQCASASARSRSSSGALVKSPAKRCVTLNVAPQPGETEGFGSTTYLEVLAVHAPDLQIDVVVADVHTVADLEVLEETVNGLGGGSSSPTSRPATAAHATTRRGWQRPTRRSCDDAGGRFSGFDTPVARPAAAGTAPDAHGPTVHGRGVPHERSGHVVRGGACCGWPCNGCVET